MDVRCVCSLFEWAGVCLEREVRDRTHPRLHSLSGTAVRQYGGTAVRQFFSTPAPLLCSWGVNERRLIGCLHTLAVRDGAWAALGRKFHPSSDRCSVHACEHGGVLARHTEPFGDEDASDGALVVPQAASAAYQSGQL